MTQSPKRLGLVDVGNTSTKWLVVEPHQITRSFNIADLTPHVFDEATNFNFDCPISWTIISVNSQKLDKFIHRLVHDRGNDTFSVLKNIEVPLGNVTQYPENVGTDRLVAAYAAAIRNPGKDRIVIDGGTAITVDLVSKNDEFLGGTIMPGIKLMLKSLFTGTDQLPPLNSRVWNGPPVPYGDNTESAILAGVYHAVWYGIKNIVKRQQALFPDAVVVYTGPSLENFVNVIPTNWSAADNLVFEGLYRLAFLKNWVTN